ncbi:MAG: methyltransferase domain-containing protein, partial [Deltaproteobacteria bacterium]|nr:methyltransferase domain-containing protein [Deltaproteobacteria bacterium]
YLMENTDEVIRLEIKTDSDAVRRQADWCGLKPGLRVLDAGCGPGLTTAILYEMIQPGGDIVGVDLSPKRIDYARQHYGKNAGIRFETHDLIEPLTRFKRFDLIWVRFVLEYNRKESRLIVEHLTERLNPGGYLCLMDLDYNCLSPYELPEPMEKVLFDLMGHLEGNYNFDPYSGRKLYAFLYDMGYQNIEMDMVPHHLIFGDVRDGDLYNWIKKVEVVSRKVEAIFHLYPGKRDGFFNDFRNFFLSPRRFTYTPLILCKGTV